jgi:hypothetical protein
MTGEIMEEKCKMIVKIHKLSSTSSPLIYDVDEVYNGHQSYFTIRKGKKILTYKKSEYRLGNVWSDKQCTCR